MSQTVEQAFWMVHFRLVKSVKMKYSPIERSVDRIGALHIITGCTLLATIQDPDFFAVKCHRNLIGNVSFICRVYIIGLSCSSYECATWWGWQLAPAACILVHMNFRWCQYLAWDLCVFWTWIGGLLYLLHFHLHTCVCNPWCIAFNSQVSHLIHILWHLANAAPWEVEKSRKENKQAFWGRPNDSHFNIFQFSWVEYSFV